MSVQKTLKLDRKNSLYLKETKTKGRGLFCRTAIKAGEILETTPAIILKESDNDAIEDTILSDYVFTTAKLTKKLRTGIGIKDMGNTSCVVMGIASYCNHDEYPNAEILWEEQNGSLYYMLQAIRKIPANTEICTSYGDDWFDDRRNMKKN